MFQDFSSQPARLLRWRDVYREAELYKAVIRVYTKPLFLWRKALRVSTDGRTLYDLAGHGLKDLAAMHEQLRTERFHFRPSVGLKYNFQRQATDALHSPLGRENCGSADLSALNRRLHPGSRLLPMHIVTTHTDWTAVNRESGRCCALPSLRSIWSSGTSRIILRPIRYVNFAGRNRDFSAERDSIERKHNHIVARVAPTGRKLTLSRDRIQNLSEVEVYLPHKTQPGADWPAGRERQILNYHKKRGTTSPRYEQLRAKYPNW